MYTQSITFDFEGSNSVGAYYTPSVKMCLPTWTPPYTSCKWAEWSKCAKKVWGACVAGWTGKDSCTWVEGVSGWCCCWTDPSFELIPPISCSYSMKVPTNFEVEVGYVVGDTLSPLGVPFACEEYTIYSFKIDANINGVEAKLDIDLGEDGITFVAFNDYYYATETLGEGKGTYEYQGFTYTLKFTISLLYCLEPEPPMSWINIQVALDVSVDYDGVKSTSSILVACPLIPPE
jgi:hypothetical protein